MSGKTRSRKPYLGYVAAFRTYSWDDDVAELARRFFAAVPSARQVVLVDETRGFIDIPGYEKISHTAETVCPGLPNYPPGRSLWFNVDYGVYALRRELPGYSHYLLSESDLAVNLSLEPMMRAVRDQAIDLVAHQVEPSTPRWFWHQQGLALSPLPWRSLLFFMVLSARAVDRLLMERTALAKRFAEGDLDIWPFCETFVPTVLKAAPRLRFAEASQFAESLDLNFRPWISLHDPRANRPGSLVHSVLGGSSFVAAHLARHPPREFFDEKSNLRRALLSVSSSQDIVAALYRALARQRDFEGVALLWRDPATRNQISGLRTDLAFCKPAVTSSVSVYSRVQDPELDASGANSDWLSQRYGFHTRTESHPWWMVDLLAPHTLEEITIVNRPEHSQRFSTFFIETSRDGTEWATCFTQSDAAAISSDEASPWRFHCDKPVLARYVRIVLLGAGLLHLRRVQVLGKPVPPEKQPPVFVHSSGPSVHAPRCMTRWPAGPRVDLALGKPALSSSVSAYSKSPDPAVDASGANSVSLQHDYGFHTSEEENPWWMVDLLEEQLVEEVAIVNRRIQSQRFRTFLIETSSDGLVWAEAFRQSTPIDVSFNPDYPWRASFSEPPLARYLRVVLLGTGWLHLRRVQAFGRALPGRIAPAMREETP